MSFDKYQPRSIQHRLQQDREDTTNQANFRHSSSSVTSAPSLVNVMRRATLGLQRLHAEMIANRKWSSSSGAHSFARSPASLTYFTNSDGFLQSSGSFTPLICKRYKVIEMIGQGSFSQVFAVDDNFNENRTLVLKIIRKGCEVLGHREKIFLQHLMEANPRGPHYFVECFGWLEFAEHIALILPLYSQTLLRFIYDSEPSPSSHNDISQQNSLTYFPLKELAPPIVPLLQPKAISRHNMASNIVSSRAAALPAVKMPSPKPPALMGSMANIGNNSKPSEPLPILESGDINNIRKIAFQLISALFILHKDGIIHGDIKPENCFVFSKSHTTSVNSEDTTPTATSSSSHRPRLSDMPPDFTIKLGDFGNSIHTSEVKQYFGEFEIQSLPYRAPEVLIGHNFNTAIDMWSLGIMLLELCINKPLFMPKTRQEAIQSIAQKVGKFDSVKFSGGLYSHLLFENSSAILTAKRTNNKEFNNLSKQEHVKSIKRIVTKSTEIHAANHEVCEMLDFLSALLVVDPVNRLTAKEAFLHPFLLPLLNLPLSLVNESFSDQQQSKKRKLSSAYLPFHSLKASDTPSSSRYLDVKPDLARRF